jgi:hypothetical protein
LQAEEREPGVTTDLIKRMYEILNYSHILPSDDHTGPYAHGN